MAGCAGKERRSGWALCLRRTHHRRLLPTVLPFPQTVARECAFLCNPGGGGARRVASLQALPTEYIHPTVERRQALCRYIEAHAEETITLEKLRHEANLSPLHLQRRFKAASGVSRLASTPKRAGCVCSGGDCAPARLSKRRFTRRVLAPSAESTSGCQTEWV